VASVVPPPGILQRFSITFTEVPMLALLSLAATLTFAGDSVIKRGGAVPARTPVTAAEVSASPERWGSDTIVIEGMVEKVCQEMGCWLQLTTAAGTPGVRITTHAQNFFVPFSSAGMRARAVGVVKVRQLTKEQADHMKEEGIDLPRKPDGSAEEIQFGATGIELRPAS
jgi:hypothetical protein